MQKYLWLVLALGLFLVANTACGVEPGDATKIEGTYSIASMIMDGKDLSVEDVKQVSMTWKEGKYTVKYGNEVVEEGTYKVNVKKKPYTIDTTATRGENRGKTRLGLYEYKDGELKICFGDLGKDRPTDFASKGGDGKTIYSLKRPAK